MGVARPGLGPGSEVRSTSGGRLTTTTPRFRLGMVVLRIMMMLLMIIILMTLDAEAKSLDN